jgi:ABC-2 type transport system ATP-binding protein
MNQYLAENEKQYKSENLAVEAIGLVKRFGKTKAVNGVDLSIPKGMVYGFLGPNGAGKTTTIRMLATLIRPDEGSASVFGHDLVMDPDGVRTRVALTGQFASVDDDLTGSENLKLIGRLLGYSRKQAYDRSLELLEAFELVEAKDRQVKTFSGGMRRRLDIAASIVVPPDLLFLDEPTTGLDPRSRNQVWEIIRTMVRHGTTILLTTQYLEEADQLADRVAVIDKGRIIAEGTPGELKSSAGAGVLRIRLQDPHQREEVRHKLSALLEREVWTEPDPGSLTARVDDTTSAARALEELGRGGYRISSFSLGQPSLDEVFLKLTGEPVQTSNSNEGEV